MDFSFSFVKQNFPLRPHASNRWGFEHAEKSFRLWPLKTRMEWFRAQWFVQNRGAISIHSGSNPPKRLNIIIVWFPFRLITARKKLKGHSRGHLDIFSAIQRFGDPAIQRFSEASAVLNQLYCCLLNVNQRKGTSPYRCAACGHAIFGCHHPHSLRNGETENF